MCWTGQITRLHIYAHVRGCQTLQTQTAEHIPGHVPSVSPLATNAHHNPYLTYWLTQWEWHALPRVILNSADTVYGCGCSHRTCHWANNSQLPSGAVFTVHDRMACRKTAHTSRKLGPGSYSLQAVLNILPELGTGLRELRPQVDLWVILLEMVQCLDPFTCCGLLSNQLEYGSELILHLLCTRSQNASRHTLADFRRLSM
jgi:hypothetical protein